MSDLRELLDLQFDPFRFNATSGSSPDGSSALMKRMMDMRHLRDPQTMARLAQMARNRPPPPPPAPQALPLIGGRGYPRHPALQQFISAPPPFAGFPDSGRLTPPPPVRGNEGQSAHKRRWTETKGEGIFSFLVFFLFFMLHTKKKGLSRRYYAMHST